MMKNFPNKIGSLAGKLIPRLEVFGLEISDGLVRFYDIGRGSNKARHILLRLPPGAVANGRVANAEILRSTLLDLHKRVSNSPKKLVSVVVSIPTNNIYVQPFNLPTLAKENMAESAELNMRMISPIDASKAYYDWQEIGESASRDQLDMVGAFVPSDIPDKFIEAVQGANFNVAAVEFSSLGLVRTSAEKGLIAKDAPGLIVQVDQGGLTFSLSHMGELYFHYFTEWDRYRGKDKKIDLGRFEEGVADEVRKLINFYLTNFKTGDIRNVLIISDSFAEQMKGALQEDLPGLQVQTATFNDANAAMGAAMRGRIARSKDVSISLASLSAVEVFRKGQIGNFVLIWRNLVLTAFGSLLLIFLGSALLLQQTAFGVASNDPFSSDSESNRRLAELEAQVGEFNGTVEALQSLKSKNGALHQTMNQLDVLIGGTVNVRRILINAVSGDVTVGGTAGSETAARGFKDRLAQDDRFANVDLPLQDFKILPGGAVDFLVKAKLKNLDI